MDARTARDIAKKELLILNRECSDPQQLIGNK